MKCRLGWTGVKCRLGWTGVKCRLGWADERREIREVIIPGDWFD